MNNLDKLIRHFEQFPGIGTRQARRFAFHILTLPESDSRELAELISNLHGSVIECTSCRRFFARQGGTTTECGICNDGERDRTKLMVVAQDNDITAIERSGVYDGLYFVLGGTLPLIDKKENNRLRGNGLKHIVEERLPDGLTEIILAFAVNPDGENTSRFVEKLLEDTLSGTESKISYLGRGLSTGSELEYADPDTIKNALTNRS
jgi:recombination protein RecR